MHWLSTLTALALAAVSAWLVFFDAWSPWEAFGVVGIAAAVLIFGAAIVLLIVAPRNERPQLIDTIRRTVRQDWKDLIKMMRLNR